MFLIQLWGASQRKGARSLKKRKSHAKEGHDREREREDGSKNQAKKIGIIDPRLPPPPGYEERERVFNQLGKEGEKTGRTSLPNIINKVG